MSYASDKLYNGYLRRRMPAIVSKVKVREIIVHLPCLTAHDRENIEAKRENYGNFDSMVLLLDCLKRRESWPEQFIQALEACEHSSIAAEIRAEYDALRGVDNSNSSPSTTVTTAHVHPAPAASPVQESVASSGDVATAPVVKPAERAEDPPISAPQTPPSLKAPVQPQGPNSTVEQPKNTNTVSPPDVVFPQETDSPPKAVSVPVVVPEPEVVSPPAAVPKPTESTRIEVSAAPVTPPPSPETPHTHREITAHQEPEENSESDIQAITGVTVLPNKINTTEMAVLTDSAANSPWSPPGGQDETNTTSDPDPPKNTSITDVQPEIQPNSDITGGSSFLTLTPEKPPVQDTTPPVVVPVIVEPGESPELFTNTQETESSAQAEAAASSPPPHNGVTEKDTSYLSKPEVLISVQAQNSDSTGISAQTLPEEPYSGDSGRLELSNSVSGGNAVSNTNVPVCSSIPLVTVNPASELTCQENSIGHNLGEPEENDYKSLADSLESEEVLVNVLQVSEEPSILNQDFQASALPTQIINGKAAEAVAPSSTSSITTTSCSSTAEGAFGPKTVCEDISPLLKTDVEENKPEVQTVTHAKEDKRIRKYVNAKYIVTAAGVGAIAVLMAWKFRN